MCDEFRKEHPSPMIDALTARARPIVRRLAVIYAVIDYSEVIDVVHLEAAYALWSYAQQTVEYIFGSAVGNRLADRVYRLLLEHRAGLTRTELYKEFGQNLTKEKLDATLRVLLERNLITARKEKRGKHTISVYFAITDHL